MNLHTWKEKRKTERTRERWCGRKNERERMGESTQERGRHGRAMARERLRGKEKRLVTWMISSRVHTTPLPSPLYPTYRHRRWQKETENGLGPTSMLQHVHMNNCIMDKYTPPIHLCKSITLTSNHLIDSLTHLTTNKLKALFLFTSNISSHFTSA